jgi:hypothetical protein
MEDAGLCVMISLQFSYMSFTNYISQKRAFDGQSLHHTYLIAPDNFKILR